MPDGAWAIDARGNLFDASSAEAIAACARRPCKALAELLFDDEVAMVRLEMSEFMEKGLVERLIGWPSTA